MVVGTYKSLKLVVPRNHEVCVFQLALPKKDAFVVEMRADEMFHRQAMGQAIFQSQSVLGQDVEERLRKTMKDINKSEFGKKTLNPKTVAQIRDDFGRTYLFYSQLSTDSAHPSVAALSRYVVTAHPDGLGFDTEPLIKPSEVAETFEYLSMACVGVCVAVCAGLRVSVT